MFPSEGRRARPYCQVLGRASSAIAAIGLLAQAQRAGVTDDDMNSRVHTLAVAEGNTGWGLDALDILVRLGRGIWIDDDRVYGNG